MRFFHTTKYRISMLAILALLLQVFVPIMGDVVFAEEIQEEPGGFTTETFEDDNNGELPTEGETDQPLEDTGAIDGEQEETEIEGKQPEDGIDKPVDEKTDQVLEEAEKVEEEQNFTIDDIKLDEELGKAEIYWTFVAGTGNKEDVEYTHESNLILVEELSGDLPIGFYTISKDGLITVTISAGQEEDAEGSFGIEGIQLLEIKSATGVSGGENRRDLGNIFTNVIVKVNDTELVDGSLIEINADTVVKLEFDWEIANEVDLKTGDWAEIKIPNLFIRDDVSIPEGANGELKWNSTTVGTYELDNHNNLIVVFNHELEGLHDRYGEVWVWMKFNEEILNEDAKQTIEFEYPIDKTFTVRVKPDGGTDAISKSGSPNEKINAEYINWVIDVNTSLEELNDAIIEDKIPEGLELISESIEIYELTVGYDGEIKSEVPSNKTANNFPIELGKIDSAYRIKYRTNILDHSKFEYENIATLKDGTHEKGTANFNIGKLEIGSSIDKEGKANNNGYNSDEITWTIDVNKAELNLKKVSVEDSELSPGLTINNESIKIYELNKQGGNWNKGNDVTDEFAFTGFPINLGDLNKKAYRIVFDTDIDYKEYQVFNEFTNKAVLNVNGEKRGEAPAKVIVRRGTLIEKNGYETTWYGDPHITWTIYLNMANHNIKNAQIKDIIGNGLKLRQDSIEIYDNNWSKITLGSINGYPKISEKSDNNFKIEFGEIDSEYRIKYITDIIDSNADLGNEAELIGDGLVGDGITDGAIKTGKLNPGNKVENFYSKESKRDGSWGTIDGITYDGLNYKDKTMSWKITLDAIKEEITNLTITDTFEPADSMVFMEGTLKILKDGKLIDDDICYTLNDNKDGGFVLEFSKGLEKAKYEIYYKTSFDPDIVLEEGGKLNTSNSYVNKATFTGTTKDVKSNEKEIKASATAKYDIEDWIWKAGKKDGVLIKGNSSDERKIKWNIYVNALGQDLKGIDFIVTDTLSEGQVYDKITLVVKEYSLNKDGSINVKDVTLEENKDYSVDWNENNKAFTLIFKDGIDKPIIVEFYTNILGISKEKYKNIAYISGKDLTKMYEDDVTYKSYNSFLLKEADVDKVYTDDEINWTLTINESLSDIEKGAILTDTISSGLVYVNDSLSIKKSNGESLVLGTDYSLENTLKESGERELKITFLENIKEKYIIEYATVVVATNGEEVKNQAVFNGEKISGETDETKTYTVTQYSGGTGSGVRPGSIKIIKHETGDVDKKLTDVGFELYYLLNGEEQLIKDKDGNTTHYTNSKGVLEFTGLRLRTYYLREVEETEGYIKLDEVYEFNLNSDTKTIDKEIPNTKKISITGKKQWVNGPTQRPTIELQLYRNGEAYGEAVKLKNGETKYIWKDLAETDIEGEPYVYTVDEVTVLENYGKSRKDNNLTVVNIYESPKTDVVGRKNWEGGPKEKPSIQLQLYRDGEKFGEPVKLDGTEEEPWTYTWKDLDRTDKKGVNYIYTVDEIEVPENYTKSKKDDVTIINTYVSPKTEITGTKKWEGGPKEKPSIELQLYRDREKLGEPVKLDGTEEEPWTYTWTDLDETNINGKKYTYRVDEVEVPRRYRKSISEDGLTITNRYRPPSRPDRPDPYEPEYPEKPEKPTDQPKDKPTIPEKPDAPEVPTTPEDPLIDIDGDIPMGGTDVDKEEPEDSDDPLIDIDGNVPKGGIKVDKPKTLPKTGENSNTLFYLIGVMLITLGFIFRRKTA